ncbi:uncharacterized protein LOC127741590 [Arachis duranensis]|uniref:ATP-dependent DNA helicase n=1 Tax=Arachis duranensis TaxID=130453 RepID=A0A9C6T9Y0_ARADU|nr:uncharacterized protein LOC127741590 [Arachis duranensis]
MADNPLQDGHTTFDSRSRSRDHYTDDRALPIHHDPRRNKREQGLRDKQGHIWKSRKQGHVNCRLTHVPHSHGEEYYLHLLLNYQKGCQRFADICSVYGIVYDTFKEACYAQGLLQDDREFIDAINEASLWASPNYIRRLFAMLLMSNNMVCLDMVSSVLLTRSNPPFSPKLKNCCSRMRVAYNTIFNAVSHGIGGFFFVYGYGGTGKTFLCNALSASIRSKGHIVLNVASSGIAALFLPNGRTAHSRFKVPLSVNQDSICNIRQGTPLAHLISSAKLIIWDEAPMLNKFCFKVLNKCLKDVLRFDHGYNPDALFSGKVVVLRGDFRQILPVIPRGSREEIVHACINASYLWQSCHVLQLTENMRLGHGPQDIHNVQLEEFTDWLLQIGDGLFGDSANCESVIRIPDNLLLDIESPSLHDLVLFVYPNILLRTSSVDYFKDRSILAPTLDVVTEVNNHVMSLIPGNEKVYLSSDTLLNEDGHLESELYTMSTESLNTLNCSGIPQHRLVLKIGVPVMLLCNIDQSNGLCNGTRMQVRRLGDHVIECVILACCNIGEVVFIPRMNMIPNNEILPIRFTRRQFPIALCFAMTTNKS